jgi:bifunctional UDP-N-acetylglucosamine pyrophosphorylase/glucosamine-1-phosphate N-acetyltransferase
VWANQLYTYWTDVGYFWNYLDANAYAAARLAPPAELGVVEGGVKLKGRVHIEPGAVVKSGATLEGPVWIGPGAEVGSGAVLRAGTVLEGGAWTGSAEISGSVLLRDAAVGDRCLVDQSVLAEGASLGEGSRVESVRGDSGPVQVLVNEKVVDSGRARLGACIGSGARLEAGVGVSPGILVGPNARVGPGYKVRDNLAKGEVLD